ncbi:MAG: carotenoid biosynthesis protein [Candidatus Thermoplasmatota archaeon]
MRFIDINFNFGDGSELLIWFIITVLISWLILLFHSIKYYGAKKTFRYFFPIILAGLFIESAGAASGRYVYPGYFIYLSIFENGWVPLAIVIGWSVNLFLFLHMAKHFINKIYKKRNLFQILSISTVAGFFAVCLDSLQDPLAHHNSWWTWSQSLSGVTFYDVPILNFVGWFLLIFYMSIATMLIERMEYTENRKVLLSISSLSITGLAILITQGIILKIFQILGIS